MHHQHTVQKVVKKMNKNRIKSLMNELKGSRALWYITVANDSLGMA